MCVFFPPFTKPAYFCLFAGEKRRCVFVACAHRSHSNFHFFCQDARWARWVDRDPAEAGAGQEGGDNKPKKKKKKKEKPKEAPKPLPEVAVGDKVDVEWEVSQGGDGRYYGAVVRVVHAPGGPIDAEFEDGAVAERSVKYRVRQLSISEQFRQFAQRGRSKAATPEWEAGDPLSGEEDPEEAAERTSKTFRAAEHTPICATNALRCHRAPDWIPHSRSVCSSCAIRHL